MFLLEQTRGRKQVLPRITLPRLVNAALSTAEVASSEHHGVPLRRGRRGTVRTAGGVRQVQRAPGPEEEGRGTGPPPAGLGACGVVRPGDKPAKPTHSRAATLSRRLTPRCRYLKPGCTSCFSECPQTRNMGLGFAALWLLAIKNALASGSSQLCEKAQGKRLKEKLAVANAA